MPSAQRLRAIDLTKAGESASSLDPEHWPALRSQAHAMLDDMLDYIRDIRARPVWQPIPPAARARFREPLPDAPEALAAIHDEFMRFVLPYATGNVHPGFMGWVHGGGTVEGMLAEMLAGGLNANLGGRDHMPIEVERQVLHWMRELFDFPDGASGLFVTGTSMANLLAVLVARHARLGRAVRRKGVGAGLRGYAAQTAHRCIGQAFDLSGLGTNALCLVPGDGQFPHRHRSARKCHPPRPRCRLDAVHAGGHGGHRGYGRDRRSQRIGGAAPSAKGSGSMSTAHSARWACCPPRSRRASRGSKGATPSPSISTNGARCPMTPASSWCATARAHKDTFANPAAYLRREARGLAGGEHWPCDFGPDLSRGFRALKTWFTIKAHGSAKLARMIAKTLRTGQASGSANPGASPGWNCWQPHRTQHRLLPLSRRPDEVNAAIVGDLQESGIAAPSTTTIDGKLAIRAALVNHRTEMRDLEAMLAGGAGIWRQARTETARFMSGAEWPRHVHASRRCSAKARATGRRRPRRRSQEPPIWKCCARTRRTPAA